MSQIASNTTLALAPLPGAGAVQLGAALRSVCLCGANAVGVLAPFTLHGPALPDVPPLHVMLSVVALGVVCSGVAYLLSLGSPTLAPRLR